MKLDTKRPPLCLFASALASLLLLGCVKSAEDTEHNHFDIDCHKRPCVLKLKTKSENEPAPEYSLRLDGRYLLACAPEQTDFNCRPISCKSTDPCSTLGGAPFECGDNGLCQAPNNQLTSMDRLAVCLSGSGAWSGSPKQRARLTLIRSSPEATTLPAACR